MSIDYFFILGIVIFTLILGNLVSYHHGQIKGKKDYREHLFKTARKESFILELEKGFEKYYIKINIVPEKDIMYKYGHGFSKIVPKERT
jgi:hypothetical protein